MVSKGVVNATWGLFVLVGSAYHPCHARRRLGCPRRFGYGRLLSVLVGPGVVTVSAPVFGSRFLLELHRRHYQVVVLSATFLNI